MNCVDRLKIIMGVLNEVQVNHKCWKVERYRKKGPHAKFIMEQGFKK